MAPPRRDSPCCPWTASESTGADQRAGFYWGPRSRLETNEIMLPDEVEPYGRYRGKVGLSVLDRLRDRPDGKLIIHNIGRGTRKEDILHAFPIIGHYRW